MSIVRFSLSTQTLPIFQPTVLDKASDANKTIYSFTMSYNGFTYQQYLQYEPQSNTSQNDEDYYNVYNYQYLTYLINQCMQQCLEGLSLLTFMDPSVTAPIVAFDISTKLFNVYFDTAYYGFNESGKINTYCNYSMMSILNTMPIYITKTNNLGNNYLFDLRQLSSYGLLYQEISTNGNINPVSSILMTSNFLPCQPSIVGSFNAIIDGTYVNTSSSNAQLSIVTDFIGNELTFNPYVQYSPYTYRWLSLRPGTEIKNVDIQCYWRSKKDSQIRPIYLSSGGSFSLKIMFSKNTSNN
jgi:hypothetical protein